MPISRRYSPEAAPGETCVYGLDFAPVIPPGVGIAAGKLSIFTNVSPPAAADADWTASAVTWIDRTLYATLSGGKTGTDYILTWTATDTQGNIWPRSSLLLVAPTS
jgi:hypothetical protein